MNKNIISAISSLAMLFILFYCNNLYSQIEKLPYYKKALEYIKEDGFVKERYSGWITKYGVFPQYYISKEILYFDPRDFRKEIIDFQFNDLDSANKLSIEGFLDNIIKTKDVYRIDSLLLGLNDETNSNLIMFFSRILWSGKYKIFTASIHIMDGTGIIGDKSILFTHKLYTEYTFTSSITYLFYINDKDEIVKVFTKQFAE